MSIVELRVPTGATKIKYGHVEMQVSGDGTIRVPRYLRDALVAAGFTTDDSASFDMREELAGASAGELSTFLQALGKPSVTEVRTENDAEGKPRMVIKTMPDEEARALAVALFDERGAPALSVT